MAVTPARDSSYSTHSVSPQAILQVYGDLGLKDPPLIELPGEVSPGKRWRCAYANFDPGGRKLSDYYYDFKVLPPEEVQVPAGRFKAIDGMRRRARFDASLTEIAARPERDTVDPAEASDDGVEDVTGALEAGLAGAPVGRIFDRGVAYDLVVKLDPKTKKVVWRFDQFDRWGHSVSNTQVLDAPAGVRR